MSLQEGKMRRYLSEVRDLVVPRLETEAERINAFTPILLWEPWNDIELIRAFTEGDLLFGLTTTSKHTIRLFSDAFNGVHSGVFQRKDGSHNPLPYGLHIAHVLIHEVGHASCDCNHDSERWEHNCNLMGIAEKVYRPEAGAIDYNKAAFTDDSLVAAIRSLNSYPGDTYDRLAEAA